MNLKKMDYKSRKNKLDRNRKLLGIGGKISFILTVSSFFGPMGVKLVLFSTAFASHIYKKNQSKIIIVNKEKFLNKKEKDIKIYKSKSMEGE